MADDESAGDYFWRKRFFVDKSDLRERVAVNRPLKKPYVAHDDRPPVSVSPSDAEYVVDPEPTQLSKVSAHELERRRLLDSRKETRHHREYLRRSLYYDKSEELANLRFEEDMIKRSLDEEERPARRKKLLQQLNLNKLAIKAKKEELKHLAKARRAPGRRVGAAAMGAVDSGHRFYRERIEKLDKAVQSLKNVEQISFNGEKGLGGIGSKCLSIPEPKLVNQLDKAKLDFPDINLKFDNDKKFPKVKFKDPGFPQLKVPDIGFKKDYNKKYNNKKKRNNRRRNNNHFKKKNNRFKNKKKPGSNRRKRPKFKKKKRRY